MLFAMFTSIILSAGIIILLPVILPAAILTFLALAMLLFVAILIGSFIPALIASTALAFIVITPIVQALAVITGAFFIGSVLYNIAEVSETLTNILQSNNSIVRYAAKFFLVLTSLAITAVPILLIPGPLASLIAIALLALGTATVIAGLTQQIANVKDESQYHQEHTKTAKPEPTMQSEQSNSSAQPESKIDHTTTQQTPTNNDTELSSKTNKNSPEQDTVTSDQQPAKEAPNTTLSVTPTTLSQATSQDHSAATTTPTGQTINANSKAVMPKDINQTTVSA